MVSDNNEKYENKNNELMENDDDRSVSKSASLFRQHDQSVYKEYIPTGFDEFDRILGGGLTSGVHYIGAASSVGKSTFCIQLADNMASHGQNVVYISLEMGQIDITAKLVSMYTMLNSVVDTSKSLTENSRYILSHAKTTTDLTNVDLSAKNTPDDWLLIEKSAEIVETHGKNIKILECIESPITPDIIELYIDCYVQRYGVAPILFVDYLQILAPDKEVERFTDKQIIDHAVTKFRALAAKYRIPVIIISSFNRTSYTKSVSMKDFKESGNIEYSADTLIALQQKNENTNNSEKAMQEFSKTIELVILKQRYGPKDVKIEFEFYPQYNYFEQISSVESSSSESSKAKAANEKSSNKTPKLTI